MTKIILASAALAAAAVATAMPALAQEAVVACTQLERSVGLMGAECGVLSLQEIAEIATRIENAR